MRHERPNGQPGADGHPGLFIPLCHLVLDPSDSVSRAACHTDRFPAGEDADPSCGRPGERGRFHTADSIAGPKGAVSVEDEAERRLVLAGTSARSRCASRQTDRTEEVA